MWNPDQFEFISGKTPLSSIEFVIFISLIHLIITIILEFWMKTRSKAFNIRNIQRYNNLLIGLFSATIFLLINIFAYRDKRFVSFDKLLCHRTRPKGIYAFLWYFFYLSKLWEFLDIYFVILNKSPILFHFRWHHQTTPSVVLFGLIGDIGYEWATILSNLLMHIILYPHFAGIWNGGVLLLIFGALQLCVGLSFSLYSLFIGCSGSFYAQLWGLFMYITYTIGYLNEHFHFFDHFLLLIFKKKK